MRALVQRVREARVEVAGAVVGQCGPGLLVLVSEDGMVAALPRRHQSANMGGV